MKKIKFSVLLLVSAILVVSLFSSCSDFLGLEDDEVRYVIGKIGVELPAKNAKTYAGELGFIFYITPSSCPINGLCTAKAIDVTIDVVKANGSIVRSTFGTIVVRSNGQDIYNRVNDVGPEEIAKVQVATGDPTVVVRYQEIDGSEITRTLTRI